MASTSFCLALGVFGRSFLTRREVSAVRFNRRDRRGRREKKRRGREIEEKKKKEKGAEKEEEKKAEIGVFFLGSLLLSFPHSLFFSFSFFPLLALFYPFSAFSAISAVKSNDPNPLRGKTNG
jgi:hypothetical protein